MLDTDKWELTRQGESVRLEPQVFALIELLVSNATVNSRIRTARQAQDESGKEQRLILTIRGHGFMVRRRSGYADGKCHR